MPCTLSTGTVSALAGAYLGARYMHKVTIGFIRWTVAVLMLLIGAALSLGIVGA